MSDYFKIGKLVATFSTEGEMAMAHSIGKRTAFKGLEVIFIEDRKNSFLPWFVESIKIKNETEVFIKLESIDNKEAAKSILQKEVWLTEEDFNKYADNSTTLSLVGYSIIENKNELGTVLEVLEQPHQILCRIEIDNKEVLIPLNESTLLKVDHKKKNIQVSLPEGLLAIYLD